ncbi:MAG: helix-turn-helix domain-containing protein [Anaerolineales bacterium]|nr:helix-turn-helix domain-containing protein [Anaerolineales bacterium]
MIITTKPHVLASLLAHPVRWKVVTSLIKSDYSVSELQRLTRKKQNLISYHLGKLQKSKLINQITSRADARESYYSLDMSILQRAFFALGDSLHPALGSTQEDQKTVKDGKPVKILFLCTHNSARSQMAEGLMRSKAGEKVEVVSAGTEPSRVHPLAVSTMERLNIDISNHESKSVEQFIKQKFDYVITVCDSAKESCPIFPGAPEQIHWSFPDPSAVKGSDSEKAEAFFDTAIQLSQRINFLLMAISRGGN